MPSLRAVLLKLLSRALIFLRRAGTMAEARLARSATCRCSNASKRRPRNEVRSVRRARARWMGHRDFFKQVAKLKDGDGQYLWRESVRVGEPDRLLGLPTGMSEYAPNTFTTGQYVAALGDFSQYWIADSMGMEMQRLTELYAETNQVGLIGRLDTDGQPVLGEAFVRVKLA